LLLTHGGNVQIHGANGGREIPAEAFFVTFLITIPEPEELLTEVRLRRWPAGTGRCFLEESRRYGDPPCSPTACSPWA
jgi:CO/xanthine dehydrogenase FAD-binding subunit